MPDTLTAQNVVSINPVQFQFTEGVMTGLVCTAEINYGRVGLTETVNVWDDLTDIQKAKVRVVYNTLRAIMENHYLGDS